jgi:hypothetical protein
MRNRDVDLVVNIGTAHPDKPWWTCTSHLAWERSDRKVRVHLTTDTRGGACWEARDPGGAILGVEVARNEHGRGSPGDALAVLLDRIDEKYPMASTVA